LVHGLGARAGSMSEPQKEAFRKYLESAGVIDAITSGKQAAAAVRAASRCPGRGHPQPSRRVGLLQR
jgi:hypothetical protein